MKMKHSNRNYMGRAFVVNHNLMQELNAAHRCIKTQQRTILQLKKALKKEQNAMKHTQVQYEQQQFEMLKAETETKLAAFVEEVKAHPLRLFPRVNVTINLFAAMEQNAYALTKRPALFPLWVLRALLHLLMLALSPIYKVYCVHSLRRALIKGVQFTPVFDKKGEDDEE